MGRGWVRLVVVWMGLEVVNWFVYMMRSAVRTTDSNLLQTRRPRVICARQFGKVNSISILFWSCF